MFKRNNIISSLVLPLLQLLHSIIPDFLVSSRLMNIENSITSYESNQIRKLFHKKTNHFKLKRLHAITVMQPKKSNKYKCTYILGTMYLKSYFQRCLFLVSAILFSLSSLPKIFPMTHPFNIYQRVIFVIIRHAYH